MVRTAVLAAALVLSGGCGTDDGSGLNGSSNSANAASSGQGNSSSSGSAGSGSTASSGTGGSGGGATTGSATGGGSSTSGSMAAGTGGGSSTNGSGGAGGGCTEMTWYCDGDSDGWGDPNVSELACSAPPGGDTKCPGPYVSSENDCGPGDPAAHPNQMSYFGMPVMPPAPSPPFDYNCSGTEEKDPAQLYNGGMNMNCSGMDCLGPILPRGFGLNSKCGSTAEYYQCMFSLGLCQLSMVMPPEPLRCR